LSTGLFKFSFDISCQGTVPEAIIAFLESENYVDAVRKGISLGADSDTIGCITGGMAQAYYRQITEEIVSLKCEVIFSRALRRHVGV
jgi:ADP-ribosylglycohydrolase